MADGDCDASPRRASEPVADEPVLVELAALRAEAGFDPWAAAGGDAFVVVSDDRMLAGVWGDPARESIRAAAAKVAPAGSLLAYADNVAAVRMALPDWRVERAWQHVLRDESTLEGVATGPVGPVTRAMVSEAELEASLREELLDAVRRGPVFAAWADGRPVAFAHAPLRTTRWYDLAVDTVPAFRRQGHATRAFAALWRQMRREGLAPAWGATEHNDASLRMAARLGFVRAGEVFVFCRTE